MKESLAPGLVHEFSYRVPPDKTVPHLYPESAEFRVMPEVFATLSHTAPTPPGRTITVRVTLARVEGRRLWFDVHARDEANVVSEGTHERVVVDAERFKQRLAGPGA